jgi:hypothetical protein
LLLLFHSWLIEKIVKFHLSLLGLNGQTTAVGLKGGIYQRRTRNGTGRSKKTVPRGTVKTQRMEKAGAISAIDEEVRFFFIFPSLSCKEKL